MTFIHMHSIHLTLLAGLSLAVASSACSGNSTSGTGSSSGGSAVGGASVAGGGGATSAGGKRTTGGSPVSEAGTGAAGGSIQPSGGSTNPAETSGAGGDTSSGGSTSPGGSQATGGAPGGSPATGGIAATAGRTGGTTATGGAAAGTTTAGGAAAGTTEAGGSTAAGGATATGGKTTTGGSRTTGGTTASGGTPTGGAAGAVGAVASFHCVNWADNRDNFVDGHLLMSGITSDTDTYEGVTTKANIVVSAFVDLVKANSFRMPINEPTALDPWWNSYKAAIDAGIAKGMKVIIGFWAKDKGIGKPVDNTRWYSMWKVVIDAYVTNPLVFYDIHNEPHGFTAQQWITQVNGWLAQFPNVPRQQIIVAGSGWDDNVGNVASSWPDLMMEIHNYANNGPTTQAGWNSNLLNRLGNAVSRTIVGEWAGTVNEDFTTGIDGNADKSFIVGTADTIFNNKMGSCWWAGAFAPSGGTSGTTFLVQKGTGASMTYTVQGAAALTYIQHSWGLN